MVFRRCSKHQGDVYLERDIDVADPLCCVQCGACRMIAAFRLPRSEPVTPSLTLQPVAKLASFPMRVALRCCFAVK
jgi:hypothetical protein